jgi:hypothetical protein
MRSSLKQADFYARAALKLGTEGKYETSFRLSIYAPALMDASNDTGVSAELRPARTKLLDQHDLTVALITASYSIRTQLARANLNHGISDNLNWMKALAAEEGRLNALIKAVESAPSSQEKTAGAAIARAKAAREQPSDRYMGRGEDGVSLAIATESDIDGWRTRLAWIVDQRSQINDALTTANVTNFIVLDKVTMETLRRAKIVMTPE